MVMGIFGRDWLQCYKTKGVLLKDSIQKPSNQKKGQRQTLALFGGTFDPVHRGHVQTVSRLQQDLAIDQIRWVLSAQPPHRNQPQATIEQRLAMLDLALEDFPNMVSDDIEVRREKTSYTIDTLEYFREHNPNASIVLIVGSDIIKSFHHWHRYADILTVANIIVMYRAGYDNKLSSELTPFETNDWTMLRNQACGHIMLYPAPVISISATQIRNAFANASSDQAQEWLDPKVLRYIEQNKIYIETKYEPKENSPFDGK